MGKSVLDRQIEVDGEIVTVRDATNEQFYYYIYGILEQMYRNAARLEIRYKKTFDKNWSKQHERVNALGDLDTMNRTRKNNKMPMVALFADD